MHEMSTFFMVKNVCTSNKFYVELQLNWDRSFRFYIWRKIYLRKYLYCNGYAKRINKRNGIRFIRSRRHSKETRHLVL